jgi:hypothetical protein
LTIREDGVNAIHVGELLEQNLQIPHYQRPYSWEPATALQLLDDIRDALNNPEHSDIPYVLGAVILHADGGRLDVVDGQQRLLTLRMMLLSLEGRGVRWSTERADNPVTRVWNVLDRRIEGLPDDERHSLIPFIREQCQLVRVVTDDVDEAFRVFDSQNYRGKPLAPHDLLKAHHLREMRDETAVMKTAVVETWESAKDEDLDRLFSVYLYRIARWSKGESAPSFTTHDTGMFNGISPSSSLAPSARYHLAAQAAIPMLNAWGTSSSAAGERDAGRTRFQLDAPLLAGRPFFEMVSFMLAELKQLRLEAFPGGWEDFASSHDSLEERPSRSRYRKVSELYLAALLYYTNRFGEEGVGAARERLFAWAYVLRVNLLRVQSQSVDNRARGKDQASSAFVVLRNASSGRTVHRLPSSSTPYNDSHEVKLVALLKGLGA